MSALWHASCNSIWRALDIQAIGHRALVLFSLSATHTDLMYLALYPSVHAKGVDMCESTPFTMRRHVNRQISVEFSASSLCDLVYSAADGRYC